MLLLGVSIGLALLSMGAAAIKYKLFSILLAVGAFLAFIAFIRNPSIPTPTLPDNIPLPGGGK